METENFSTLVNVDWLEQSCKSYLVKDCSSNFGEEIVFHRSSVVS